MKRVKIKQEVIGEVDDFVVPARVGRLVSADKFLEIRVLFLKDRKILQIQYSRWTIEHESRGEAKSFYVRLWCWCSNGQWVER